MLGGMLGLALLAAAASADARERSMHRVTVTDQAQSGNKRSCRTLCAVPTEISIPPLIGEDMLGFRLERLP